MGKAIVKIHRIDSQPISDIFPDNVAEYTYGTEVYNTVLCLYQNSNAIRRSGSDTGQD